MNKSQETYIKNFFLNNPNRDIPHAEVVDLVSKKYYEETQQVFRDPDRAIRKLHQKGFLLKIKKGVYKYDPNFVSNPKLEDFSAKQKEEILKRDGYKCVICGKGREHGEELHVDHIKPKDKGGKAIIENGQILCSQHNFQKKNLQQTETGKKMFIRLLELAEAENNDKLIKFIKDVLQKYEEHDINGHIRWDKK